MVSVIIVTYNNERDIDPCLSAVFKQGLECAIEVVVVDNCSEDGTLDVISDRFPAARVVRLDANSGFSAANRAGVAASTGQYFLFLNPDTEIEPGTVRGLRVAYRNEFGDDLGLFGPRLLNRDGTSQASCRQFPNLRNMLMHSLLLDRLPFLRRYGDYMQYGFDYSRCQRVDWLTGACLFTSRAAYELAGGWDVDFFLFGEDVYLSWCYARAGMERVYYPAARVYHFEGASIGLLSERRGRQSAMSEQILWRKMYGEQKARRIRNLALAGLYLRRLVAHLSGGRRLGYYDARIHAFRSGE